MKASGTALKLASLASVLLMLQGCATATMEAEVSVPSATPVTSEILHRVRPHERLGDIAIRYTGNATNWEKIARHNGISNPRNLRIGAMIAIPNSLVLRQGPQPQASAATGQELKLVAVSLPNTTTPTTNTLALKRSTPQKSTAVVLESDKTNRAFTLSPTKESRLTNQA
ncbi:MAG: hypothetical protein ACI9XK_004943, partial [Granulosicoccus sp.]